MNHADPNVDSYARTLVQLRRAILKASITGDVASLERLQATESSEPYADAAVVERAKELAHEADEQLWPDQVNL